MREGRRHLHRRKGWVGDYRWRDVCEGYLFALPWLLGFLIFILGPMLASLYLSCTEWNLITPLRWVGVRNYHTLFLEDRLFWQSLKVTSIYSLAIPVRLLVALMVALLMNQKIRGLAVFRTVYYMPAVVSGVAVAQLWRWIFNGEYGLLNWGLWRILGVKGPAWLADENWALPALIVMSFWGFGNSMVIFLAGLQGIPGQLYEAAAIDGASGWRRFLHITLPMLSPVIMFNLIMGVIGSFQVFTSSYVMTRGGPHYATLFYVLYLYQNAFEWSKMGYASALAWVLFLIILVLTLIQFRLSRRWVYYGGVKM